jgi:phage baseplate assembly protein W
MVTRYKGFSTVDRTKKFSLVDFELVKQDLINHFSIKKGQKLMNPNFGSLVWNALYEPLTEDVKSTIVNDVTRIVTYDPRLRVDQVILDEFDNGLQIEIDMTFLPGDFSDRLSLTFDSTSNKLTAV